jgi:hypothetical protein
MLWPFGKRLYETHKGIIERLYADPPAGAAVVCLDEMGPQAAKSSPG